MSIILNGLDLSDTADWWGWTMGSGGAQGFVEPASRSDFFHEIVDLFAKHDQRNSKIMSSLPALWEDYEKIMSASVKARYLPSATVDDAAYRRARKRLRRIADYWRQYRQAT